MSGAFLKSAISAATLPLAWLEPGPGEGPGVHDAVDGADLFDDDPSQGVEVRGLDLGEQVVFSAEGMDVGDVRHVREGVVDVAFLAGFCVDEDES